MKKKKNTHTHRCSMRKEKNHQQSSIRTRHTPTNKEEARGWRPRQNQPLPPHTYTSLAHTSHRITAQSPPSATSGDIKPFVPQAPEKWRWSDHDVLISHLDKFRQCLRFRARPKVTNGETSASTSVLVNYEWWWGRMSLLKRRNMSAKPNPVLLLLISFVAWMVFVEWIGLTKPHYLVILA